MDNIDITSPDFSLENSLSENSLLGGDIDLSEYSYYIYIAILFSVIMAGFLIYRFMLHREKHVTFQDKLDSCYGDVCER